MSKRVPFASDLWAQLPTATLAGYSDPSVFARIREAFRGLVEEFAFVRGTWSEKNEYLTSATENGVLGLANGGSGANLTGNSGGIVYSLASAMGILPGTATAGQVLQSGASAAPTWSATAYPSATTISQILYSPAANSVTGLATANNGVLVTSGSGVPSIATSLPTAVQGAITTLGKTSTYGGQTLAGNGLAAAVGSVALTGLTYALATTTLTVAPASGLYLFSGYLECTLVGLGGTVDVWISAQDDIGTISWMAMTIGVTNVGSTSMIVSQVAVSGSAISYFTTLTGVTGNPQYGLYLALERLS